VGHRGHLRLRPAGEAVLRLVAVTDGGATAAYRAEHPGEAFSRSGLCQHTGSGQATDGPCRIVRVIVSAA